MSRALQEIWTVGRVEDTVMVTVDGDCLTGMNVHSGTGKCHLLS